MRKVSQREFVEVTKKCRMRHSHKAVEYYRQGKKIAVAAFNGNKKPRKVSYYIAAE